MEYSLRPWKPEDLESLVRYANNERISGNLTNRFPHPYSEADGRAFIAMATMELPVSIFAIDIGGEACGGIGLHAQADIASKNMELGYWLGEPFWGKGIITRAVIHMVEYGFNTWDITRIFARPFGSNVASQRVLEKAGFILEGRFEKTFYKNGRFEDELIYAVRKKIDAAD